MKFLSSLRLLKGFMMSRCYFALIYYYYALWTSLLFSPFNADAVFAELQLPGETDLSISGSDTLGDWYLDPEYPGGLFLDDPTVRTSFESASLLPTTSWVDSVEPLFPQDDLFANDIAAADCPSAGIKPKNKFRTRQACMQTPQVPLEVIPPKKGAGSTDESLPKDLGLFEPYDPFAYGEKDEDSCPPARFGDKKYSVCDSGDRNMFSVDQLGYANLQYCKPGA